MRRVSTGNSKLDEVLGGGLVADAITLVVGAPGSGKTILAEQCLFANATDDRPGLYLSTASEPLDKLLRYGQTFDFFDVGAIGRSVFYDELGNALIHDGLSGVLERVDSLVKMRRPGTMMIDSFKALAAFAHDQAEFRRFLHDLAGRLSVMAISSLWVGEYQASTSDGQAEFAIADTIISLETRRTAERSVRLLGVRKQRGSDFLSGEHLYRISSSGLQVFPRLADLRDGTEYRMSDTRVPSGVPALDAALEEGYWPGSATLVVGPSGVGKTLMGLHFIFEGGARNESGLILTLQENRTQLSRTVQRFGWSVDDPRVTILDRSPVDVYMDEVIYELLDCLERTGARRVLIDALGDLAATASDQRRFSEFVYSLVQRCSRRGVSVMFTYEIVELFRVTRLSESGMSHIADNVLLLQHVRDGAKMKRTLTVLKSRASQNMSTTREFQISDHGIMLGDPIDAEHATGSS